MSKQLYDELQEAFETLKKTEAEKIYDAVENKEFPPIPFTLPVVLNTIKEVLEKHEISKDELISALSLNAHDLSADDMMALKNIVDNYEQKTNK